MTTNGKSRHVATLKDQMMIHDFLKGVLEKTSDGLWAYKGTLTDVGVCEQLRAKFSGPLSPVSVATVRKEMFGQLRRGGDRPGGFGKPSPEFEAMKDQIVKLSEIVNGYSARLTVLEQNGKHMQSQIDAMRLKINTISR